MRSIDILYYSLAIAALGIASGIVYVAYSLVDTMRSLKKIVDDIADVSEDIRGTKDFLKKDVLAKLFGLAREFFATKYEQRTTARTRSS